jgi:Family of unknown function (DUF6175)
MNLGKYVVIFCMIMGSQFNSLMCQTIKKSIQPSVMVVPFKKQSEKFIDKIEELRAYRTAIAKVDEYFLSRNYRTIDFITQYELSQQDALKLYDKNLSLEQSIAMNANADIMVYFDTEYKNNGADRYVNIYLKAIDAATAQVMSSAEAISNTGNFDDYSLYVTSAIMNLGDNFLNTLSEQYEDIKLNGRPTRIIFDISNANITMESEIGGLPLSDHLYTTLEEIALNEYVSCNVTVEKRYGCDDVRMPIEKDGKKYNINHFVRDLRKALNQNLPTIKYKISNTGGNISIQIL